MEKDKLEQCIKDSETIVEVLEKMRISEYHNGYKIFKRHVEKYNIDISHFLNKKQIMENKYNLGILKRISTDLMLTENSKYTRSSVKRHIIHEKLIDYKCVFCQNEGEWMGKKISLILDHINGKNNDHRLENLRFVCPNCNASLETHCKGSKGYGMKERKEETIRQKKLKYKPKITTRKVIRPDIKTLTKLVDELGYTKTGKIYGVSDNSIRKWIKWLNDESIKK